MPSLAKAIRHMRSTHTRAVLDDVPLTAASPKRLRRLSDFGSNPGALAGWTYVPSVTADPLGLVVVLHGCTQTAAGYDHGSGWSELAERFGFAVLFPEQQRANNSNLCFNWFQEEDTRRGSGEAHSIQQMVETMIVRHPIDASRIFVTGLSAGGAMANVMLATYPEYFAGGSIIAGLPYGTAKSVPQAMERMRGSGLASASASADTIRRASSHQGKWPRITVWHGDADRTVAHANAGAILKQWRGVHGMDDAPDRLDMVDGQRHRVWLDDDGSVGLEEYQIAGLGHGAPLATTGRNGCGHAGAFMLEAGISSTYRQAENWGLIGASETSGKVVAARAVEEEPEPMTTDLATGITATIEQALRSAGLLR